MLTLGSLFDGIGTWQLSAKHNGIKPLWSCEIDPYPSAVSHYHFPETKQYGDIKEIHGNSIEPVDILCAGTPCTDLSLAGNRKGLAGEQSSLFYEAIRILQEMRRATNGKYPRFFVWENVCFRKGTLITCENGYKPIEQVGIGDKVKTLSGKLLPVYKLHKNKNKRVFKLICKGSLPLFVTGNHPFYSRCKISANKYDSPRWLKASELTPDHMIGYVLDNPTLPNNFISKEIAWAIGRYIADGSVDLKRSSPRIFISVGIGKLEEARSHIYKLPYKIHENSPHPTAVNMVFTSHEFYGYISDAGIGAGNKQVPNYVFQLPIELQKEVLRGYLSGDGYIRNRYKGSTEIYASTASKKLALGIARLIRNCYHTGVSISEKDVSSIIHKIGERELCVNYPMYNIYATIGRNTKQSFYEDGVVWQNVISLEKVSGAESVYNLSVMEDNTYEANGVIVHNCGAFTSNHGNDFRTVLEEIGQAKIPMPKSGRWATCGVARVPLCDIAWRTLDAQYWGVPQRRRRIFLVADFATTGRCAAEILLIEKRLPRNSSESSGKEQDSSSGVRTGTQGTGDVKTYSAQSYTEIKESNSAATLKAQGGALGGVQRITLP